MSESNAVTKAPPKMPNTMPLAKVTSLQDAFDHPDFAKRVAGAVPKTMSPDRMIRTFVQACHRTPMLVKVPVMQLVGAFMTCALIGLEPNTPLQHCHLIPFQKWRNRSGTWEVERVDINLIFGYPGLLDLSFRSGMVMNVHADAVWSNDDFSFSYGTGAHLRHRPTGHHHDGERPTHAYMHASIKGGGEAFEVMPYNDVLLIRNSSQGYQSALKARDEAEKKNRAAPPAFTEAPWVKHEIAMARKTAFRAGSKWLPRSIELAAALHIDEAQDRKLIDFGAAVIDQDAITIGLPEQSDSDSDTTQSTTQTRQREAPATNEQERVTTTTQTATRSQTAAKPQQTRVVDDGPPAGHPAAGDDDSQSSETSDETAQDGASGDVYYLSDEQGEPIEGPEGATEDPIKFLQALRGRWETSRDRRNLMENNADTIQAACAASTDAAKWFEDQDWSEAPAHEKQTKTTTKASKSTYPLQFPSKGGRVDFVGATGLVRTTIAGMTDLADVIEFDDAHRSIIDKFPAIAKSNIRTLIAQRRGELGEVASDPDQDWLNSIIENDLPNFKTSRDLRATLGSTVMTTRFARIEREKPEMYERFKTTVNARDTELAGKAV